MCVLIVLVIATGIILAIDSSTDSLTPKVITGVIATAIIGFLIYGLYPQYNEVSSRDVTIPEKVRIVNHSELKDGSMNTPSHDMDFHIIESTNDLIYILENYDYGRDYKITYTFDDGTSHTEHFDNIKEAIDNAQPMSSTFTIPSYKTKEIKTYSKSRWMDNTSVRLADPEPKGIWKKADNKLNLTVNIDIDWRYNAKIKGSTEIEGIIRTKQDVDIRMTHW